MQYNPILDLVMGIVMILVPVLLLIGCGVWLIVSRNKQATVPTPTPSPPEKPIDEEILRSLELLRQHQDRLIEEMRDLSEDNRKRLRILQEETERIRNLLKREIASPARIEPRLESIEYRDN